MYNCENCLHWKPNKSDYNDGLCKRFPPTPVWTGNQIGSFYPETYHDELCGEWKHAEEEEYEQYPVIE